MTVKKTTGFFFGLICFVLALGLMSCNRAGAARPSDLGDGPVEITLALNFDGIEPPPLGADAQRRVEEYTNTRLFPTWYANWGQVYPAMLASGDLPDIITTSDNALTRDSMLAGMFWDLNNFLADTNHIKNLNPVILQNASQDGMLIGTPKVRPLVRRIILYRKDWADNLGIAHPRTVPEFYEMLRAFTYDDPTGTGARTYGLATQTDGLSLTFFSFFFDGPNTWDNRNGEFVHEFTTQEFFQGMSFLRRLFAEGIMHPEWATIPRNQQNVVFQDGMILGGMLNNTNSFLQNGAPLASRMPESDVAGIIHLVSPTGQVRSIGESGNNGFLSIPSTVPEAKARRIMRFLDMLADEEMASLFVWGIEGIHHTVQNGQAVHIPGTEARFVAEVRYPWELPFGVVRYETFARPGIFNRFNIMQMEIEDEGELYSHTNPTFGLFSQTMAERGSSLDQLRSDAAVRFVNGIINEDQYWAEVTRWRNQGGDQIARELADAFARSRR